MGNSQDFRFLTFNGYVSQNLRTATQKKMSFIFTLTMAAFVEIYSGVVLMKI